MIEKRAEPPAPLTMADYRLLADFRHILRGFLVFSEERALELGLAPQQHQVLLAIKGHEDEALSVGELARHLVVKHNSAVGLINRLVRAGYVVRKPDPADGRRATLKLTRKGEKVLEKLTATHRTQLRQIAPTLRTILRQLDR